jgi:hypothetical protein
MIELYEGFSYDLAAKLLNISEALGIEAFQSGTVANGNTLLLEYRSHGFELESTHTLSLAGTRCTFIRTVLCVDIPIFLRVA